MKSILDMKVMTAVWIVIGLTWGIIAVIWCMPAPATAYEPTTLDEAVERPFKIERYIDQQNGVVCYWNTRHPAYLTCVKVTNTTKRYVR